MRGLQERVREAVSQLNRVADWVESRGEAVAIAIAAATALAFTLRSVHMVLWLDEIYTILMARLPRVSDVWAACWDGADGMPPLYYLVVRALVNLGWNDSLAVRLPCVIGYAVFTYCLFRFVARQSPAVYGIVAMLLPSIEGSFFYATDGRPYGLILGCTGVAMVCWQSISRGDRRGWVAWLLVLTLAFASAVHFMGFLLAFAIAVAEGFRVIQRRQVDWRVLVGICSPAPVLAIYAPLMVNAKSHMGVHWGKPLLMPAISDVLETFVLTALPVLAAILIAGFAYRQFSPKRQEADAVKGLPTGEFVLVLAVLSLPAVALLIGRVVTHVFVARHVVEVTGALAVIFTYSIGALFRDRREPVLLVAFFMVAAFGLSQLRHSEGLGSTAHRIPAQAVASAVPIAVTNPFTFMTMRYYDPVLSKRITYVAGPEPALRLGGSNSGEYLMMQQARYFDINVAQYDRFISQHAEFLCVWGRRIPQLDDAAIDARWGGGRTHRVGL